MDDMLEYSNNGAQFSQNNRLQQYTQETFMALVDAIIPQSPELANEYGRIQYYGALDLFLDEYMIMSLNSTVLLLADSTAAMLNIAADQLVANGENSEVLDYVRFPGGSTFAALAPSDRFRALTLLEQLQVNLEVLPIPFQNNPAAVISITSDLGRLALMGYYSEWSGYGSTRMFPPNQRILEYFPLSWQQVGFPGISLGYRALRSDNWYGR